MSGTIGWLRNEKLAVRKPGPLTSRIGALFLGFCRLISNFNRRELFRPATTLVTTVDHPHASDSNTDSQCALLRPSVVAVAAPLSASMES